MYSILLFSWGALVKNREEFGGNGIYINDYSIIICILLSWVRRGPGKDDDGVSNPTPVKGWEGTSSG